MILYLDLVQIHEEAVVFTVNKLALWLCNIQDERCTDKLSLVRLIATFWRSSSFSLFLLCSHFLSSYITFWDANSAVSHLLITFRFFCVSNEMCILCKTAFVFSVLGLQSVLAVRYDSFPFCFPKLTHCYHLFYCSFLYTSTQILYKVRLLWTEQYFIHNKYIFEKDKYNYELYLAVGRFNL